VEQIEEKGNDVPVYTKPVISHKVNKGSREISRASINNHNRSSVKTKEDSLLLSKHEISKSFDRSFYNPSYLSRNTVTSHSNKSNNSSLFMSFVKQKNKISFNSKSSKKINTSVNTRIDYFLPDNNLFDQMKLKVFTSIFRQIDADDDNEISIVNAALNRITDRNIKEFIMPIIRKLKEEFCVIKYEDFLSYCEAIYETLTHDKKNAIMDIGKCKRKQNKSHSHFSFKPKINKK